MSRSYKFRNRDNTYNDYILMSFKKSNSFRLVSDEFKKNSLLKSRVKRRKIYSLKHFMKNLNKGSRNRVNMKLKNIERSFDYEDAEIIPEVKNSSDFF